MYMLDAQGFRLEHVPESSLDDITVIRREDSPTMLFFLKYGESIPANTEFDIAPPMPDNPLLED
jgi:hypothetical protein